MTSPQLRIVLIDTDHSRRMSIEKTLSNLGYHRVLPVSSMRELIVLMDNAIDVFDLLVVNEEIMRSVGVELDQLLCGYSCIRHSLVYQSAALHVLPDTRTLFSTYQFMASGVPDRSVLLQVMGQIEKPQ